ncbi:MAG: YfcE family phosphodiesterase [Oscillospiraceae bacterium]|nr:YfcE family phosphodiesterase [Oscillospiraceae bacterium]
MRILVMSDSHGRKSVIEKIIEKQPLAEHIIFLGDGVQEMEEVSYLYPDKQFHLVSGNCDFYSNYKSTDTLTVCGVKIMFTHGHNYKVKYSTDELENQARSVGAQIALYGHTHVHNIEYKDGLYIVNPGTVASSYAVIDITTKDIVPIIINV